MRAADVLPEPDWSERHALRIDAPDETILAAARAVTLAEMPLARLLIAIRGLRAPTDRRIFDMAASGLGLTRLDDAVWAGVMRPWRNEGGGRVEIANLESLRNFRVNGYVKVAMDLFVEPAGTLVTETRIQATDAAAHRAFGRYWLVVRPGSGLIRRAFLRAARHRATA